MPALNKNITVRLRADASNFNASIKAAGANAQQLADGMEQSGRKTSLLTTGLAAAGMAAGALGVAAIKTASDFDASMSGVQSATRASASEMDLLRQAAIQAGADTIYGATDAAGAIEELGKAGISTTDILNGGLIGALNLAASDGMEVADAAGYMSTALTQFNLSGADATRVADTLAAGAGKALGSVSDMGEALNNSGAMAHSFGLGLEETVGVLAAFASQGQIGAEGGTLLSSVLNNLTAQTEKQKEAMKEYGITLYDQEGNFVGMASLAGQLQDKLGGLTREQRNAAIAAMFDSYARKGVLALYQEGAQGIQEWTDAVSDSGYAAEMASARTDNLQGDLEQLSGSFETLLINLGEGGQGPLRSLVQTLDTLVDAFAGLPPEVQQTAVLAVAAVGGFTALHKALTPLNTSASKTAQAFGLMIDPGQRLITALPQLKSGFAQLGQAAVGVSTGMGVMANGMTRGQTALSGLKGIAGGVVSLLGGPFGIALTVAGGLLLGFAKDAQEAKAKTQEFADAIDSGDDILEKLIRDISSGNDGTWGFWDKATTGFDSLGEALDKAGVSYSTFAEAVDGSKEAQEEFEQQLMDSGLDGIQLDAIRSAYDELSGQVSNAKDQVQKTNEEVAKVQGTSEDAAAATGELGDEMSDTADSTQDYADALDDLIDSLFELEGVHVSAYEAQTQLQESIQSLTDSLAENGNTLDINTEQGRANRDALSSLASQAMDTAQAILEEGAQMDASGQTTDGLTNATEQARASLENARTAFVNAAVAAGMTQADAEALATQFGLTGGKADELKTKIENIPNSKTVSVSTPGLSDAIVSAMTLKEKLDALQSKTITITQVMRTELQAATGAPSTVNTVGPLKDGYKEADGGLIGYATGGLLSLANGDGYSGLIHGWGGKKADVMPIMASRGEFMQQASAVDYYGVDAMKALNERKIPREWLAGPQQVVAVAAPEVKSSSTTVVVDNQSVVDAIRQAVREMPGIIRKNTPVMGKRDAYRVAREAVNGR